jgi:hypothetical protein
VLHDIGGTTVATEMQDVLSRVVGDLRAGIVDVFDSGAHLCSNRRPYIDFSTTSLLQSQTLYLPFNN